MSDVIAIQPEPAAIVPMSGEAAPPPFGLAQLPPNRLTIMGLQAAIGLAFVGILGALVLCVVLLVKGFTSKDVIMIRMLLSCVAIFVSTGFAALGFALFLIKADGALKAKLARGVDTGTLETTAPGLVVFLCATVIMYLALHMNLSLAGDRFDGEVPPPTTPPPGMAADSARAPSAAVPDAPPPAPLGGVMEVPR